MGKSATTAATKAGKGNAAAVVGAEVNAESTNLLGGMDATTLAQQLGAPNPEKATAQSIMQHIRKLYPNASAESVLKAFGEPDGGVKLIAAFGPKTGVESGMDFEASPMSEKTGGKPGDAARQAGETMTTSFDTNSVTVPKEGWNEGFAAGMKAAKAGKKNTGTTSLNVSTQGVKAAKAPKAPKVEQTKATGTPATGAAAGGEGGGSGGGTTAVGESGEAPKGDGGKKALSSRLAQPEGGYIDAAINKVFSIGMNELKGLGKAAAVYGAGDYLVGGPLYRRYMGSPDDKEQRIADMLEGRHGYGDESKASWGLADEQIPAGDAAAPADKLRKMGVIK